MKQVIQSARSGKLSLAEVPAPQAAPGSLLVRTRASLISAGTERLVIDFARKSLAAKAKARPDLVRKVVDKAKRDGLAATARAVMARLDEPLPLGYSAAGEVVEIGQGLEGRFRVGDRVAMAGAGLANHAEMNAIPANLAVQIPGDVDHADACFGTLAAIALQGVRNLDVRLGETVAVIGAGLLGQLAVQLLALSGIRPIALDYDPDRLALAAGSGAEMTHNLADPGLAEKVADLTNGFNCDGLLICAATASSEPFSTAANIARDRARVVLVGMTGTELPYREFMQKELTVTVSRSYGPGRYDPAFEGQGLTYPPGFVRWTETENLREATRLMSPALPRRLDVAALTTHRFDIAEAENAYDLVTGGTEPHLGVVLTYGDRPQAAHPPKFDTPPAAEGRCVLGVLGAGNYARTVLLPALKSHHDVLLRTIVTTRGATADHAKNAFGFETASTDPAAVFDDPGISAVLIATRHASHADLTARALAAGKRVLVEKPLALDRAQLDRVAGAREGSTAFFQVGFNRRFAPLARRLRDGLTEAVGPKVLSLRINAGPLPADSWVNAEEEGGGRILGEVCHFVDLARFLVGAPILSVQADSARVVHGVCDDLAATLRFADGSLATLSYTAQGDTAFSKERIEAFAGGRVWVLDDFRRLTFVSNGKEKPESRSQDKGARALLAAFVSATVSGGPPPVDEHELIETSLATLAVVESLRAGHRIDLAGAGAGDDA